MLVGRNKLFRIMVFLLLLLLWIRQGKSSFSFYSVILRFEAMKADATFGYVSLFSLQMEKELRLVMLMFDLNSGR